MSTNTLVVLVVALVGATHAAFDASDAGMSEPAVRTAQYCLPQQDELPGATRLYCGRFSPPRGPGDGWFFGGMLGARVGPGYRASRYSWDDERR